MIVATVNTKGGTAKTTTTINLANELALTNPGTPVIVGDLDKQGSATEWADIARDSGEPLPFSVEVCNNKRLPRIADEVRGSGGALFIDTPPGDSAAIQAAITVADFVIIPTLASGLDTSRVWETLRTLDDQMHAVLLTSVRLGTNLFVDTKRAFDDEDISRFETVIPLRESIRAAYGYRPKHEPAYADVLNEMIGALA